MNETAVEIEMRKQMRERVASRIAGLGEDFRNTARESVEQMLREMFVQAVFEGGRLEVLLSPGKSIVDRIDALGRAGHVSESVVRYQNIEMAKADVAFEVLSRYFARQIIEILDATDAGDRELREREMRGLEQFFGMGIVDRAQGGASGVMGAMNAARARAGLGGESQPGDPMQMQPAQPGLGAFPSVGASAFPTTPAQPVRTQPAPTEPGHPPQGQPAAGGFAGQAQGPVRDWTKMLARVRADVERICNFLEALAKHPRGLQKYHEEAVRTVHDSWIDREGEQSLRRWVRSECSQVWPHKFAAIEAEKERARSDIQALEELFGARAEADGKAPQPPAAAGPGARAEA